MCVTCSVSDTSHLPEDTLLDIKSFLSSRNVLPYNAKYKASAHVLLPTPLRLSTLSLFKPVTICKPGRKSTDTGVSPTDRKFLIVSFFYLIMVKYDS